MVLDVAHVAAECVPFAKTGGLADVVGALPWTQRALGARVRVVLPFYPSVAALAPRERGRLRVEAPAATIDASVWTLEREGVELWFLRHDPYFYRDGLYGDSRGDYPDNAVRFAFLAHAALKLLAAAPPDVVHVHDWHTALLPALVRFGPPGPLAAARLVLTVHNLAYQGWFPAPAYLYTGLDWSHFVPDRLEFYGGISYLKAGLVAADLLTTVSPTYAREILTPEHGERLDGVLRARAGVLHGVVNGLDERLWDPAADTYLAQRYGPGELRGKAECKRAFTAEHGLAPGAPLLGFVGRLAHQKGADVLASALPTWLDEGGTAVVLGSGESEVASRLRALAQPGRMVFVQDLQEPLAHRLYAACDLLAVPSRFEPCGLAQLIAMRYGTLPVAHATGGLVDTVPDLDASTAGTGLLFAPLEPEVLGARLRDARALLGTGRAHDAQLRGMRRDLSWRRPAAEYLALYGAR